MPLGRSAVVRRRKVVRNADDNQSSFPSQAISVIQVRHSGVTSVGIDTTIMVRPDFIEQGHNVEVLV